MKKLCVFILLFTAMAFSISVVRTPADKSYEDKTAYSFSELKDIFYDREPVTYELWYFDASASDWTQTLPSWISAADSTGSYHFSGTTPYVCSNTPYTLQFRGFNPSLDSASVSFKINVQNSNQAPQIRGGILYYECRAFENSDRFLYALDYINPYNWAKIDTCFTDDYPDGHSGRTNLTYNMYGTWPGTVYIRNDGILLGNPGNEPGCSFTVYASATDMCGRESGLLEIIIKIDYNLMYAEIPDLYVRRGDPFDYKFDNPVSEQYYGEKVLDLRMIDKPAWVNFDVTDDGDSIRIYGQAPDDVCHQCLRQEIKGTKCSSYTSSGTIFNININDNPPRVSKPNPSVSFVPNSEISIDIFPDTFSDDFPRDSLKVWANLEGQSGLPSWLNYENYHFWGTAPDVCNQAYTIEIWAEDHCGQRVEDDFTIFVKNKSPLLANPMPNHSVISGTSWSYTFPEDVFISQDHLPVTHYDVLEEGCGSPPWWINFNSSTRTLYGNVPDWMESWSLELWAGTDCSAQVPDYFDIFADNADNFFSSGTGTSSNPYIITNYDQLNNIRALKSSSGKYFRLAADIDMNGLPWEPLGLSPTFKNHFDGGGYKIKNLKMDRSIANAGLFGIVENSQIKNLTLENFDIAGSTKAGTLAGTVMGNSTIKNIKSSGEVKIKQDFLDYYTLGGGLIGLVATGSTVLDSLVFEGSVTGFERVGGLIGMMHEGATLTHSYSTGTVSLTDKSDTRFAGGLIGVAEIEGGAGVVAQPITINKVYSNSAVYGNKANTGSTGDVGGLIGLLNSGATLSDSYATGDVFGPDAGTGSHRGTGGLIGRSLNTATQISKVYSKGAVSGSASANQIGGLIGASDITASASFWDVQSSGQTASAGGAAGKTTAEMKTESTFTSAGWDLSNIWDVDGVNNDGYPCFKWKNYPGIPSNLNIVFASVSPELTWEDPSGAASYKIYSSTDPYAPFPSGWTIEATVSMLSWIDTNAGASAKKFYVVIAVN